MKIKKKNIALIIIVAAMLIFIMSMYIRTLLNNTGGLIKAADNHTYSYFISGGESSNYYTDYAENPGMQYWFGKQFETSDGKVSNIAFDFLIPPQGAGTDTLNNLLANKNTWPDVIDSTYSSMSVKDAYEAGNLIDLSPYIEECMPNYMAKLRSYGIEDKCMQYADGEWRYLAITNFQDLDISTSWGGYQYRRDWIVKYGTPVEGSRADIDGGFLGYYSLNLDGTECRVSAENYDSAIVNGDSWVDNITFPSWERRNDADGAHGGMKWYADWCNENGKTWDGTHPVTISDWEWMFDFFQKAIDAQNIADGYVHSLYYPGYIENGDFVTGFGGIGAHFYYDDDDRISFGAMQDGFKAYLQCMNAWYNNGWIDQQFSTNSTSTFYAIDDDLVRQGKIGCWYGTLSTLGARIHKTELPYANGAVVSTAAQPINDVYDADGNAIDNGRVLTGDVALSIPNCFYAQTEYSKGSVWFSTNILDNGKDLKLLLRAIDWIYGEEGSRIRALGLSKEQLDDISTSDYVREMYKKYGFENGTYTMLTNDNGEAVYHRNTILNINSELLSVLAPQKIIGYMNKKNIDYGFTPTYTSALEQYNLYKNTSFTSARLVKYITTDAEAKFMSQTSSRITTTYLYQEIPRFIKGLKSLDEDWQAVCDGLVSRGVQRCIDINNKYLDELDAAGEL
jgi:hypothetical protein